MQKLFVSCSNEHLHGKETVIATLKRLEIPFIEGQPDEPSMEFHDRYRLNKLPLQKYSSSAAHTIRTMSEEFDPEHGWDLVIHALGHHNHKIEEILAHRSIVQPGVVVSCRSNCWDNLLDGCFISTVSDYYLIATYPRMVDTIQNKAWDALRAEPRDATSSVEASFYTETNFNFNSDMQLELTNGTVVYID